MSILCLEEIHSYVSQLMKLKTGIKKTSSLCCQPAPLNTRMSSFYTSMWKMNEWQLLHYTQ